MVKQIDYFNNIKLLCVLDMIITHVIMTRHQEIPGFWRFFIIQSSYMMQVLFFISGYFLYDSYKKSSIKDFLKRKVIRLGVPILIFSPIFLTHSENVGVLYFWYTETLLFFCFVYALIMKMRIIDYSKITSFKLIYFIVCAVLVGLCCAYIRTIYPIGRWIHWARLISIEPAHIIQYIFMLVVGILFKKNNWLLNMKKEIKWIILFLGFISMLGVARLPLNTSGIPFCINEAFCILFFPLGVIFYCEKHLNSSNSILNWLKANSYGAYVVHGLVLVPLDILFQKLNLGTSVHIILLIFPTLFFTYALSSVLRKFKFVKMVLG